MNRTRYLGAFALICAAVLAYGYWRVATRAAVSMTVVNAPRDGKAEPVFNAELIVRDFGGKELAKGRSDDRFGVVRFAHPQLGSCEDAEKAAMVSAEGRSKWQDCISGKFHWQADWAPRVAALDIAFAQCRLQGIPLQLRRLRDEWWLWWVPLRHIGGDPLTDFSAKVIVTETPCAARISGIYE